MSDKINYILDRLCDYASSDFSLSDDIVNYYKKIILEEINNNGKISKENANNKGQQQDTQSK